jgi:long-chain-fatty-acid--[acyl-carrier-protein] ligase
MTTILRYFFYGLFRFFLMLRYRLRVHGMDKLRELKGPVLVLPNHPAYVDPMLVFAALWPRLKMRPMVFAGNFRNPLFRLMAWLLNAHKVPELDRTSSEARAQAESAVAAVVEGLKNGENHILWPAGHVHRTEGITRIGSARGAADVLQGAPEASVLLVRTRGLWGSSFSFAQTGTKPNMFQRMFAGAGWIFANLLFFMPRRTVDITLEPVPRSQLPPPRREELNPWLEHWYNEGGPEPPTYVPYHFLFGRRTFQFPDLSKAAAGDAGRVKPETKEAVAHILADKLGRPLTAEEQRPETALDHFGLDSLDRMEISLQVERQFGFTADQTPLTVGQLWQLAQGLAEKKPPKPPPPAWFTPPSAGPVEILADTIPEAFVARALASPKDVILADDLAGVLTYRRLLVGVLLMAKRFAELPGTNVGLLLPASAGCDIALLGLHMAGKLPVVLNWTTGPANLAHAAEVMKLRHVVTSKAFIDRTGIEVPGTDYLFLEEVGRGIGRLEKLTTLLKVALVPGSVRKWLPRIDPEQPAVVLFTSGSEKAPKAVPLTHKNILSDQRSGIIVMELKRTDIFFGFLPAFHSFGMTVTGLLPLLGGIRVVRHPDPTDAANLARKIAAYKVTILIGTPTFIHHILERSKPGEMPSLRLIVVGAEKCPQSVFDLCARVAPAATVLEGYGITECAPVVSVNPPPAPRPGSIGKPMPGIDVIVIDLETDEVLPPGRMGMLLVSGPTVFPGYLDYSGPSPFVEREGKRWYVTGDLAEYDEDGYLWFRGRLKRFLKAGGEMISLPALEEPFARMFPPTDDGPSVAVEGVEYEGGRRIVLFTTKPISLREANALLLEKGFHGVMRLDEVRQVDRIPVLGTGKTDYKVLRAQILEGLHQPQASGTGR